MPQEFGPRELSLWCLQELSRGDGSEGRFKVWLGLGSADETLGQSQRIVAIAEDPCWVVVGNCAGKPGFLLKIPQKGAGRW